MFLVNQVFKGRFTFVMTGVLYGSKEEQMDAFVDALDLFGFECKERPENWMAAFTVLRKFMIREKKVVKENGRITSTRLL